MASLSWHDAPDWRARETLLAWGRQFRHERLVRQAVAKVTASRDLGGLDDDELAALSSELLSRMGGEQAGPACLGCDGEIGEPLARLGSVLCQNCRDGLARIEAAS